MPYSLALFTRPEFEVDIECLDDQTAFSEFDIKHIGLGMTGGIPFPDEIVPRNFRINGDTAPESGFFNSRAAGYAVDERIVSAVERIEPGVHKFHQIFIEMQGGYFIKNKYYLLNCCSLIDSIDKNNQNIGIDYFMDDQEKHPIPVSYNMVGRDFGKLTLIKDKIEGRAM